MSRKTLALVGFAVRCIVFIVLSIPPLSFIWYPLAWAFYLYSYKRNPETPPLQQTFSRSTPFYQYGLLIAEQNLTFYPRSHTTGESLEAAIRPLVEKVLHALPRFTTRLTDPQIRTVAITDASVPGQTYEKTFLEYSAETHFKTRLSILFSVNAAHDQVAVRWWTLVRSRVTLGKAIIAGLIAPFTILSWGVKQLQGRYSIKAALASDLEHDYDVLDVDAWLSSFESQVISNLIHELKGEGFSVDETQAIQSYNALRLGDNSQIQIGTLAGIPARRGVIEEKARQTLVSPVVTPVIDVTTPSPEAFAKRLATESVAIEPTVKVLAVPPSSIALDDTVEVPQIFIEPTAEIEEVMPHHLNELQQMLNYHVQSLSADSQHNARAVINELMVELGTGDEISIKILTDLLGEVRTTLGEMALRDTLEMLTDPTGNFNDIVQEITGDMLANLGDEMMLRAKKRELNETLTEYANKLEVVKRPQARVLIFSLMHTLDQPESQSYGAILKEIAHQLGREAYEYTLQMIEAEENQFPVAAQQQAKRDIEIHLKKQDLRTMLLSRTTTLELLKQEKAIEVIDRLLIALEDPEITDFKAMFREIGVRLGRGAYEMMLRKLAAGEAYFPIAQANARRDLDIYERSQQLSGN